MSAAISKRRAVGSALAFALVVVAIAIRFNRLTVWPLSLDESYSAFGAGNSFDFIWNILPTYETHPPFYTALLRCWTLLAGNSIFELRLLGVLAGLLTLAIVWLAAGEAAEIAGRARAGVSFPALALAASTPTLVDMARFVRPYCLLILTYSVGIWAVLRLKREYDATERLASWPWAAYLLSLVLLVWLHNLGALYVLALVISLIVLIGPVRMLRDHWRAFFVGHALALLATLPALLILRDQAGTWTQSTWLAFVPSSLPFFTGLIFGWHDLFGVTAGLLLTALGLFAMGSARSRLAFALLALALLPIILSALISFTIAPVFLVRTLAACSVAMTVIMALGASTGILPRAILCILFAYQLVTNLQIQNHAPDQNWYGAARWLAAHIEPGDMVYAYPNEGALPLRFALRDLKLGVPIRDIPGGIPAHDPKGWYPTGSRGVQSLSPERLAEIAGDETSRNSPTIWLLRYNLRFYDKTDTFLRIMRQRRTEVQHFSDHDIDIRGMQRPSPVKPSAQPAPPQQP